MKDEEWEGVWEETRVNIQKQRKTYSKNLLWPWNLTEFIIVILLVVEGWKGIFPQMQEPV